MSKYIYLVKQKAKENVEEHQVESENNGDTFFNRCQKVEGGKVIVQWNVVYKDFGNKLK